MKKWLFLFIFVLGAGSAVVVTRHFTSQIPTSLHRVSPDAQYCDLSCCLPESIKLSTSQKEQIQNLERNYCQCRDTLSVQIDQKRMALAEILLLPNPDPSEIDKRLEDIAWLQKELEAKTISHILAVKNQLTPEQQEQFIKPIVFEIRRRGQPGNH